MAGNTRGPEPIGGKVHTRIGDQRLARVDAWAAARGKGRPEAIRALIDVGMEACPIRAVDDTQKAALEARRVELVRELAEIDTELDDDDARGRLTLAFYLWHRADYNLLQQNLEKPSEGNPDD